MRDLRPVNAKRPAYKLLREEGFEVFTPMKYRWVTLKGKRIREEFPFMRDLLFVYTLKSQLDPMVEKNPTLQYRFLKGGKYKEPMIVRTKEMDRFIKAIKSVDKPVYYTIEEITPKMFGRRVRIIGGPLDGCEGSLLTIRGSKVKRLIVELPGVLATVVEINPELVEILK